MKYRHLSLFIIVVFALCCAACGRSDAKKWRIGISQCSDDDWRTELNEEIQREMMFLEDAEVEIRSADDSNEKQISDIRYFIDNGFDLIIASPNEAGPIAPIISEAYNRGIPVITFDRDVAGNDYTAHLEVDNYGLGKSAAEYALNILPSHDARIIEIQGMENMTPTQKRHKGFTDVIAQHYRTKLLASVYGNWDEELTAHLVDSLLDVYPDVDLIYAHNDRMAIAAAQTARSKGRTGIRFLGIDGTTDIGIRAVADGTIDATFLYPTEGARLIGTAMAILKGEPFNREEEVAPLSAIDKSNADIILQQRRLQKGEIEKIRQLKGALDDFSERHSAQSLLLYATVVIIVCLFGLCFLILRAFWQHKRYQNKLMEKNRQLEAQRDLQNDLYKQLDDATQSKLAFFTNVSHDLRTPLTLIAEPVEQLLDDRDISPAGRHELLLMADRNVKILKRLINQILDFRKYENGKLPLVLSEIDFAQLAREWIESFETIARKHHIKLICDIKPDGCQSIALDVEKIERVIFNLMSNAFKYTPDNGEITFRCGCDGSELVFSVTDTGIGIPPADLTKIFDRFYQVDKVHPNGSGIGLALTKSFIELHGGRIDVESRAGEGTVFTVRIPVSHVAEKWAGSPVSISEKDIESELYRDEIQLELKPMDAAKPTVLVIDDNKDIQKMISGILGADYNVITADNGKAGVKMAAKHVPDLIICDLMMPVMDGLECCRTVKAEISTSHIPVLMLTACSLDEQRVEGYESGADGYLPKPFNGAVLRARCGNLIANRKRIRDLYKPGAPTPDTVTEHEPLMLSRDIDSDFYARFLELAEQHIGDSELSIDLLAGKMGLGQSQFSRKIKSLTNFTPVELIRTLRLKKARTLITSSEKSLSEIAYEVGFASPAYFSKCFKDAYGETPTDLRNRLTSGK